MANEPRYSITPVASGEYVVSKSKNRILAAYLGTCVGVALYDTKAGIGGLVHLLLPEPSDAANPWHPGAYASTGLPLFIRELCLAGGSKERMEACIAGGSLVQPLTDRDLALDIGGRTAEVVERILARENIRIVKSEIGGYFSCLLSLNLRTWHSNIEPIGPPPEASDSIRFEALSPARIDEAIERVLPIPQVALKIIRLARDDSCALKQMAEEIVQDQVICARVLRLCNSIALGKTMRIDSIEKALMRLGDKHIVQIVLATAVEDFLSRSEHGYSLCKGGLFNHALKTAGIAGTLARLTGATSPDLAYTAGLLHDIGKVVLDQYICRLYPLFYRKTQLEGEDLIAAEKELIGISHTEAGVRLAQRWFFPANLADVIEHHHLPERAAIDPVLCHIIYLANVIMSRFAVGGQLEKMSADFLDSSLKVVGLGPDRFSYLIECVSKDLSGAAL